MKSDASKKKFPANAAQRDAAIVRAPGRDRPLNAKEEAAWGEAVTVNDGGYHAVRNAVKAKRKPGQRGAQAAPTKQLVSVRYSPEVLAFFKASGEGWQTRMDEALKQWVAKHRRAEKRVA